MNGMKARRPLPFTTVLLNLLLAALTGTLLTGAFVPTAAQPDSPPLTVVERRP